MGLAVALGLLLIGELGLRLLRGAPVPLEPFVRAVWKMEGPAFEIERGKIAPVFQDRDMVAPFAPQPEPGVARVFVLGGSSIRGGSRLPTSDEAPARLEAALQNKGLSVEVINLGRPALDSHHHLEIMKQSLEFGPDLFVLYMGHNDLGNAALEDRYGNVAASIGLRARLLLSRLATYVLLQELLRGPRADTPSRGAARDPPVSSQRRGVREGTKRSCQADDPRRQLAARDLEANLVGMAGLAAEAGAGIVMVTPVSNWAERRPVGESCPELLPRRPGPRARERASGIPLLGEPELAAALAQRPECPELLYERGRTRLLAGDPGAYEDLRAAMEADSLPLRATRAMTDAVRNAAALTGAHLLDLEAQAERENGAPPPRWFMDVVHLSREGQLVLALRLEPLVIEALGLQAKDQEVSIPTPAG